MWYTIRDMWHTIRDTWYVIHNMWYVICDTWYTVHNKAKVLGGSFCVLEDVWGVYSTTQGIQITWHTIRYVLSHTTTCTLYKTSSSKVQYWAQGSWWLLLCLAGCVQSMGMRAMMGPTIRKQQSMLKQNTTKKMHKYYTQTSMNVKTKYNKLNTTNKIQPTKYRNTISKHQINF